LALSCLFPDGATCGFRLRSIWHLRVAVSPAIARTRSSDALVPDQQLDPTQATVLCHRPFTDGRCPRTGPAEIRHNSTLGRRNGAGLFGFGHGPRTMARRQSCLRGPLGTPPLHGISRGAIDMAFASRHRCRFAAQPDGIKRGADFTQASWRREWSGRTHPIRRLGHDSCNHPFENGSYLERDHGFSAAVSRGLRIAFGV